MAKKRNIKGILKTTILIALLIFFLVIAFCQMYESVSINDDAERIVLGVNASNVSGFGSALKGQMVPVGDYVGMVSGGNFIIIDKNAEVKTKGNFMLSDPILHSKGKYCIVSDFGGKTVRLYEEGEVITEFETDGKVISVVTNSNGFFAVATEETGYNAVINVYHKDGEPIYRYRISENTFIDMDISANNRKLLVAEANLSAGTIGSNIVVADFNRVDAESEFYVSSNLYVNVHFNKNGSFVAMGNEGIDFYRSDCSKHTSISFLGRSLISADISTDDFVCLAFKGAGDAPVGASTLEIYDKNGKLRGSAAFNDEIEHISVNGSYVSVSHGEILDIVKSNGKIKKTIEATSPIKYAVNFNTGSSALIFAGGNTSVVR